jgi:D-lactate dehydrogenase
MKKRKIAFFGIKPWEVEYIKPKLTKFDPLFFEDKYDAKYRDQILESEIISPFILSTIGEKQINSLKNLKFIAVRSTGYDHIDLVAAKKRGIPVSNVPVYGDNTVAEHTFALILALLKKLPASINKTRKGDFSYEGLRGHDLKDKTIGIVGTGNIGKQVVKIAKGFGMKVVAYDINKSEEVIKSGVEYLDLKELYSVSDIVSFHVPYNKHTHHMLNLDNLKDFKKGCYIINTARGGICDATTLLKGYKEGIFAGIGLDVLEEENFIREEMELITNDFQNKRMRDYKIALENHLLAKQDNIIITPHNAFNTVEALRRILDTTVDNIEAFVDNNPINVVN